MTDTCGKIDGLRGEFTFDSDLPDAALRGFDAFRHEWEKQFGDGFLLSDFRSAETGRLRVTGRGIIVHDVAITNLHTVSAIRAVASHRHDDQVRMYVVSRGAWTLGDTRDHPAHTVSAGQFLLRRFGLSSYFEIAPNTTVKILSLPSSMLGPLLGKRTVTGATVSAEMRLLLAHMNMVEDTATVLGPTGISAAHSTLIELTKAVAIHRFDEVEPRLMPALAQSAKDLANVRLADPELSPAILARELNVSVRTLQRAFSAGEESLTSYIRHRRLEEARLALTAPHGQLSVSELATHWQFADSSHFIRAFKKRYGQTPTEYTRSTRSTGSVQS